MWAVVLYAASIRQALCSALADEVPVGAVIEHRAATAWTPDAAEIEFLELDLSRFYSFAGTTLFRGNRRDQPIRRVNV